MSVTLKDIAEELGVSVTTVSRALTGRAGQSPDAAAGDGEGIRARL